MQTFADFCRQKGGYAFILAMASGDTVRGANDRKVQIFAGFFREKGASKIVKCPQMSGIVRSKGADAFILLTWVEKK